MYDPASARRSHHYMGLNRFEDRSHTYAPLIGELCRRVAAVHPNARFIAGSTGMWFVYLMLVVLMSGLGILLLLVPLETLFSMTGAAGALIALVMFGSTVWRMMRKGKGRDFDPQQPPAVLLGQ